MERTQPASFQLHGFSIPEFTFKEVPSEYSNVQTNLFPSGIYDTSLGEYTLVVAFIANAFKVNNPTDTRELLSGFLRATFEIDEHPSLDNIPEFFYQNCLAIMFPYIRAFISNITLQAGTRVLILPLLNLTHLTETLKKNTKTTLEP